MRKTHRNESGKVVYVEWYACGRHIFETPGGVHIELDSTPTGDRGTPEELEAIADLETTAGEN